MPYWLCCLSRSEQLQDLLLLERSFLGLILPHGRRTIQSVLRGQRYAKRATVEMAQLDRATLSSSHSQFDPAQEVVGDACKDDAQLEADVYAT